MSISAETYRKLSSQIESQFPQWIQNEGPNFVAFMKAYYEFMEQTGNPIDVSRGLYDMRDIDRTMEDFVEYFKRQYMANIPEGAETDKRLLIKHIRDFYRSRGSPDSYRFLFRAMFNEEIEFYYPGEDILRASDGRWVQETIIRGTKNTGDPSALDSKEVTGLTSGARARVQEILRIDASGVAVYQMTVENVSGDFVEDEVVEDSFGNSIKVFNSIGSIQTVIITKGGLYHVTGDELLLTGESGGTARGTVTAATDISGLTFKILKGGRGYRKGNTTISISGGDPTIPAQFSILNLSNAENVTINSDTIDPLKNVTLNSVPFNAGSATLKTKNVYSTLTSALTFSSVSVGQINTIALLEPGNYPGTLPTVTVVDSEVATQRFPDAIFGGYKGENAVISPVRAYGAITRISIESSSIDFLKNDVITIRNLTRSYANTTDLTSDTVNGQTRGLRRAGVYSGSSTSVIEGTFELPGRYVDTKGFLSWNNKLRDNEYYQEFSYVLRATQLLDSYADFVKKLVHPAGTKMFAEYITHSTANLAGDQNSVGSAIVTWKRSPNNQVAAYTSGTKTLRLTLGPNWLANGVLVSGSNLFVVPSSNTSSANGLYSVNAIASVKSLTLKNRFENGAFTNGYFYYATSYKGNI
jgi:hypothetical protein